MSHVHVYTCTYNYSPVHTYVDILSIAPVKKRSRSINPNEFERVLNAKSSHQWAVNEVRMYVCVYVCICMYVYICMYVCMYVYICMYVCIYVCMYVCMYL